ncbi:DUF7344 domain-containing protein [Halocatena marina]|uniref:DUF7344 domain-containing protein n=1 Tax=Halocatena marina TaxID=2934937 RepID=UPI00200CBD12|nr:hypothetical protein [Halocatena marina]
MSTRASPSEQSGISPPASAEEITPPTLERDDVFHLLQNQRRRSVLRYLFENPAIDSVEMRVVTEQVAAWENNTTVTKLTSNARQRVYIALYQSHLPKLDDAGVIAYDQNRGTIEPCSLLDELEPYLFTDTTPDSGASETVEESADETTQQETESEMTSETESEAGWSVSWNDYYLGLSVLSLLLVVAVTLLFPTLSAGPWPLLSAIIGSVFGLSALIQRS